MRTDTVDIELDTLRAVLSSTVLAFELQGASRDWGYRRRSSVGWLFRKGEKLCYSAKANR